MALWLQVVLPTADEPKVSRMTRVVLRHFKSNAVAYLALFVALGGTSYAALQIPANSVGNRQLKKHSISADKLDRSSIAGYMRDWVTIGQAGNITGSRPRARLIGWTETGPAPGGIVQWSKPIPASCFALATSGVVPSPSSYASAQVASGGAKHDGQATVQISTPDTTVNVAIVCPQP